MQLSGMRLGRCLHCELLPVAIWLACRPCILHAGVGELDEIRTVSSFYVNVAASPGARMRREVSPKGPTISIIVIRVVCQS